MNWNYRVIKRTISEHETELSIHEVYYHDDGTLHAHSEDTVEMICGDIDELRHMLELMRECLDKPILEFADFEL